MNRLILSLLLAAGFAGDAGAKTSGLEVPAGARIYAYQEAAVYAAIATPGRITDIVLEPGEVLTGALAAGDTARWVIGDTASGAGETRRVHVMIKPTLPNLSTNLIINTDRRSYHLELRASATTWNSQVSWRYAPRAEPVVTGAAGERPQPFDAARINLAYRIEGDRPSWRPLRVFDDGRRTYVEFQDGVALGELPPLYLLGDDGQSAELVNYHVNGRRLVVDRLFDRAELRLGVRKSAMRVRLVRLSPVEAAR